FGQQRAVRVGSIHERPGSGDVIDDGRPWAGSHIIAPLQSVVVALVSREGDSDVVAKSCNRQEARHPSHLKCANVATVANTLSLLSVAGRGEVRAARPGSSRTSPMR